MKQKGLTHRFTIQGFTLIELLTVIAIIGILSVVILASLNTARAKTRDAKRLSDKKQVVNALNLYYTNNGAWPPTPSGLWRCLAPSSESCAYVSGVPTYPGLDTLVTAMQPYISSFPKNNADANTLAYDRLVFASNLPTGTFGGGSPAGAYLGWAQEIAPPSSSCPSTYAVQHPDKYYYCYEFVGPP